MKYQDLQAVHEAVKTNIQLLISSKGESPLVGLEEFTPEQLNKFDSLYEYYARKEFNALTVHSA